MAPGMRAVLTGICLTTLANICLAYPTWDNPWWPRDLLEKFDATFEELERQRPPQGPFVCTTLKSWRVENLIASGTEGDRIDRIIGYGCEQPASSQTTWICEPSRPDTVCAGPVLGTVFNWEKEREAGPGQTSMMEEEDVEVGPGDINTVVLAMRFTDDGEEEGQEEGAVQEDKNKEDAQSVAERGTDDSSLQVEEDWPVQNLELGQVSGVAVCPAGHVHVFHRGDRVWDSSSFDDDNVYQQQDLGPIQTDTVVELDPSTGDLVRSWGKGIFFLPHGLAMDGDGNYWLTDVAMHQVFKFPASGDSVPLLTLGEAFQPGSDDKHFCKPTDVAVDDSTGDFFVADGYCNSRVMKFSKDGALLLQWGRPSPQGYSLSGPPPGTFRIPHSLTMVQDRGEVCVADRENGRVQCFDIKEGKFSRMFREREFGGRVFAVDYNPDQGGVLHLVNGPTLAGATLPVEGFTVRFSDGEILDTWRPTPRGFSQPHDVASAPDDSAVYVVEIGPNKVWKFVPANEQPNVILPA
ncbi:peptidyl-glycine alpha-amidating monooxygenase A-like [Branchiostoma floridae x Branchiostoma japonicum]